MTIGASFALLLLNRASRAEEGDVPIALQAALMLKVAEYDRNLARRGGDSVNVLLVARTGDAGAELAVQQMLDALKGAAPVGEQPIRLSTAPYTTAAALAALCRARRASILYVGRGLEDQIPAIADALRGVDVLSVGAATSYAALGIVVGFDLVSGKPKLLINLKQARQQNVALQPAVLKLAKVLE
jgi:hypothetical protein